MGGEGEREREGRGGGGEGRRGKARQGKQKGREADKQVFVLFSITWKIHILFALIFVGAWKTEFERNE